MNRLRATLQKHSARIGWVLFGLMLVGEIVGFCLVDLQHPLPEVGAASDPASGSQPPAWIFVA